MTDNYKLEKVGITINDYQIGHIAETTALLATSIENSVATNFELSISPFTLP